MAPKSSALIKRQERPMPPNCKRWLVPIVVALVSFSGYATARDEGVCEQGLPKGASGICNAFCNAQECEAQEIESRSCRQLRRQWERKTGESLFPCENVPVGNNKSGPIAM